MTNGESAKDPQQRMLAAILAAVLGIGGAGGVASLVRTAPGDVFREVQDLKRDTDSLLEMHARYDSDGTPLWYVPRSWGATQEELLETLREVKAQLRDNGLLLQRIAQLLEKH